MVKIIIIGNGFDLAHGVKTSYNDFIEDYIKQVCIVSRSSNRYKDQLIESSVGYSPTTFPISNPVHFLDFFYQTPGNFQLNSDFLKILLNEKKEKKWVDIENTFFQELFRNINFDAKKNNNPKRKNVNYPKIDSLNNDLDFLKIKLIDYLKRETERVHPESDQRYIDFFLRGLDPNNTNNIYFINFNYTNTVGLYTQKMIDSYQQGNRSIKVKIDQINIHGSIINENEEPIFGIGDEHHEMYKAIKDFEGIQSILKNSKSFWYQRNSNYMRIVNILNQDKRQRRRFKVEVYGHSCGLSDRTLLKNIFEHERVKEIELFHYGGLDGYIRQSYDVWRHFDDSHVYRTKLVPFKEGNEMPQVKGKPKLIN